MADLNNIKVPSTSPTVYLDFIDSLLLITDNNVIGGTGIAQSI
jgi:hypothetical protein